jgi:DNA-binding SARP family transcriptional activator
MVATNALLKALWPDEQPSTARKMLQNAISGVRAAELS